MTQKVFMHNPYLREINAKIINKQYNNGNFLITLDKTIFYPHMSGGQPMDKGSINGITVKNVFEKGEDIVHVLEKDITSENVRLSIDWDTRFDHMQQHAGQHLLSAIFYNLFRAETVGFHLGKEYVYIDITLSKISEEDIIKIEKFSNKIVFSNLDIKTYYIDNNNIKDLPLRKKPSVKSNIRIVEIDSIDYSPCCGTHPRSTGEIGLIKIRKWEKYKGNIRVEFVCGNRALKDYRWKNNAVNNISTLLSQKDKDVEKGVQKLKDRIQQLENTNKKLKKELLKYKSIELMSNTIKYKSVYIINKIFYDANLKDVKYIMNNIIQNNDGMIVILGIRNKEKCQLLMGRSKNVNIDLRKIFNSVIHIINGKGGGSVSSVQGGGNIGEKLQECLDTSIELIKMEV